MLIIVIINGTDEVLMALVKYQNIIKCWKLDPSYGQQLFRPTRAQQHGSGVPKIREHVAPRDLSIRQSILINIVTCT